MSNRLFNMVCILFMFAFISCQSRFKISTEDFEDEFMATLNDSSSMVTMNDFEGVQIASTRLSELLKIPVSDSSKLSRDNGPVEEYFSKKNSYNLDIGKIRLHVKIGRSKKPYSIQSSKSHNHDLLTIDLGYDANNGEPKDYRVQYNEPKYNSMTEKYEFKSKYDRFFSFYEKSSFEDEDGEVVNKGKGDDANAMQLRYSFSEKLRKIVTACFSYKHY